MRRATWWVALAGSTPAVASRHNFSARPPRVICRGVSENNLPVVAGGTSPPPGLRFAHTHTRAQFAGSRRGLSVFLYPSSCFCLFIFFVRESSKLFLSCSHLTCPCPGASHTRRNPTAQSPLGPAGQGVRGRAGAAMDAMHTVLAGLASKVPLVLPSGSTLQQPRSGSGPCRTSCVDRRIVPSS